MPQIKKLILENRIWSQDRREADADYFTNMAKTQEPKVLWIGCADSRVPPEAIVDANPGTLFTHRNIANLVYKDDENLMSVLEYGVRYLKVEYIVVCGHTGCGGVKAAFDGIDNKRLASWTRSIGELKKVNAPKDVNDLVKMNVKAQVKTLSELPVVKEAQASNKNYPKLVGMIYDIATGEIDEIERIDLVGDNV